MKMKRGLPKKVMPIAWKGQFERAIIRARLETPNCSACIAESSPHSVREHVRGF
jgi:hypothetical protein